MFNYLRYTFCVSIIISTLFLLVLSLNVMKNAQHMMCDAQEEGSMCRKNISKKTNHRSLVERWPVIKICTDCQHTYMYIELLFCNNKATVTWFIDSRIHRSKWNRPDGKINVIPPLYFVLCRWAESRYTKPTLNLPWMVIKLQNEKKINTRAMQHYHSNAVVCFWNASSYQKIVLLILKKYGSSMYFSTSQKIILFFTSLPNVCLLRFPRVNWVF